MIFPSWIASITPGAIGIWVLVIIGLAHLFREWRLTRKLSLDDRLARRDGYAAQVASLQAENRKLRADMDERDQAHYDDITKMRDAHARYRDLCEQEHEQNREEIRGLRDKIAGLERRLGASDDAAFRAIPDGAKSEIVVAAAERVAVIKGEGHERED